MFNPIIGMIHNVSADTWHPVVFVEDPLPGPWSEDKPVRHKSKMHHTGGFPTRDEAVTNARTELAQAIADSGQFIGEPRFALDADIPWDGQGIPAMKTFFTPTPDGRLVAL